MTKAASGEVRLEWLDGSLNVVSNSDRIRITSTGNAISITPTEQDFNDGYGLILNLSFSLVTPLTVANGGTGATTATAAFNNLSPITTKGDLIVGGAGGTDVRLPIGTIDGQILTVDSASPGGMKWV